MKKYLLVLAVLAFAAGFTISCKDPNPEPEPQEEEIDPSTLEKLSFSVPITDDDWVFSGKPYFIIHASNPNAVAVTVEAKVEIKTDKGKSVMTVTKEESIPANGEKDIRVAPDNNMDPGFYQARCMAKSLERNKVVRSFVFGVDPTSIVSAPDAQPDFNTFWESALAQLDAIPVNDESVRMIYISTVYSRKVYFVEMNSVPDGLSGDPVKIRGYYVEPQDGKKHPVLMHFFGYDSAPSGKMSLYSGVSADYAEFYLSHRGQYINARRADQRSDGIDEDFTNTYGDWFAFNFGQRDAYYYRGAFMDCVQAVRFMATQSVCDMNNVFAEGSSQGGALSYACAALSPIKLNAIAPNVAFLGDFPDYFQIVSWPGNTAKSHKGTMTDDEMYAFLSYFDTKNLATRISSTAVLATIGMQDGTCPPHTNIAPYNNLPHNDKEMHYYPEMQHSYPPGWDNMYLEFFKKHMK